MNRLADEQSPYLLQHKDNPVDWYPWSDAAFEKARAEDKPIFLSIGYSTCHWCHVMEHESFEDEDVAALMNDAVVAIKVDREERPDVDGVYMTACQMMTGQGGWPLSVFMTHDRKPFHVATYIPKASRFGRVGMLELIPRIEQAWRERRAEVLKAAENVAASLRSAATPSTGDEPDAGVLTAAYASLRDRFDPEHGGFGSAPKFPSAHNLLFLLRYWKHTGEHGALEMVERTLDHMRRGGIYDHLGFGFHRYSTDRAWLVPHFEKMMYDQAMLAAACVETWQATGRSLFKRTAEETFDYVLRDMQAEAGAFYSAEDADSEGREGLFYLWTIPQVHEVLSEEDAAYVIDTFHLDPDGNFADEATGLQTGENILHLRRSVDEIADPERLTRIRDVLFEAREHRVRPGRDDKILTDWNGLVVAALAKASAAFEADRFLHEAGRAAEFLLNEMRGDSGRLLHRYRNGEAAVDAMLDDYAYLVWGLIELYEAGFNVRFLREAVALQKDQIAHFWDEAEGGFFFTAHDAEGLLMRQKELHDGALPSGNAVSALNMLRLSRLTGDTDLELRAARVFAAASGGLERMPAGFTGLLSALAFALGPSSEVVIAPGEDDAQARKLLRVVRESFRPNQIVLRRGSDDALDDVAPYTSQQTARDGRAAVYVCRDFQCEAPVSDPDELRRALQSV